MDQYLVGLLAIIGVLALMFVASYYIDGRFPKFFDPLHAAMKENLRFVIIGLAILGAVFIYAASTRYYYVPQRSAILDRWTGKIVKP